MAGGTTGATATTVARASAGETGSRASRDRAPGPGTERRRWRAASLGGGLLALVPQLGLLLGGGFLRPNYLGGFYDAQAHSLLDLRWDVPASVLSIEAFMVDDKAYMYFGPTPALLRLPVAALTDRFDGRLTALSLLLAMVVALIATTDLGWRVRSLVRPEARVVTIDLWAAGASTFLVGAGSTLLFLTSAPVVYHEALAWGVALALAADAALLAYATGRRPRALAAAVALATAAVLARPSVGLGPVLALGLLLAVEVVAAVRSRRGAGRRPRHLAALAGGAAIPVLLYVAVNFAKFRSAVGFPLGAQALSQFDPARQEFLRRSGGTLFGAEYAPTTVLQYARPDALAANRTFPWIDFPGRARPLFDVQFDIIDRASSAVATMPWLVLLAGLGIGALLVRRRPGTRRAAGALWAPVLGALAAAPVTLAFAYIAARYLADFLPLLLLPALVALHALLGRRTERPARALLVTVAVGGLVGVVTNLALATQYQGVYGPVTEEAQRARLVRWQVAADRVLPGNQSPVVARLGPGDTLPRQARAGDLAVVGDCAGTYQFDGGAWRPVEVTPAVGAVRLRTRLGAPGPGGSAQLLVGGRGRGARSLTVEVLGDRRAVLVLRYADHIVRGDPFEVGGRGEVVEAQLDRRLRTVTVRVHDQVVLGDTLYGPPDDEVRVAPGWPAPVELLPDDTSTCDGLA